MYLDLDLSTVACTWPQRWWQVLRRGKTMPRPTVSVGVSLGTHIPVPYLPGMVLAARFYHLFCHTP